MKIIGWPSGPWARALADALGAEAFELEVRHFPDGETLVRLPCEVEGCDVVFAASLDHPDAKVLPLFFAADAARELGAAHVRLAVPYLPYMRQDIRFHPGEAVSSRTFARLVSSTFDSLVTVDPHLHRWTSLSQIYSIPARIVPAAPAIARWVASTIDAPLIVGPDAESGQWAREVARLANAPCVVMEKVRRGDRDVRVALNGDLPQDARTAILVDDIVSSGATLVAAAQALRERGLHDCMAAVVHALFDDHALAAMRSAGIARIASCDTVVHQTNAISMAEALADALRES
jgi:ribose-phosphate pyrophosphokinase